jgi:WS/DGAT/MGAT family acyltransferase
LNRPINGQRRIATQQYDFDRIERLAEATNSDVDTIIAYLCGSSLRRFFKEYNALPSRSLVGAAPVSLRDGNARGADKAVTSIGISLGTHIGDPLARLEAVRQSVEEARQHFARLPKDAITPYILLRSLPMVASQTPGLGRLVPPLFNLAISNMPAPDKPQYYSGAQLEALYPIAPLTQHSALSIDCVSYAGTINFGLTGARDTLPHLQRLAVYMGQAAADLEEVLALAQGDIP